VKAVLLDADGVLFDATELHKTTLQTALTPYGYTITEEEHRTVFNGLPTRVKLDILTETKGLPRELHTEIEEAKQRGTLTAIPDTVHPIPKLIEALRRLRKTGMKLAICSNARLKSVIEMARCAEISGYFDLILGNESVLRNKPYPDIYLLAAKQIEVAITDCIIVEDSPKGLVAAISAGPGKIIKVMSPADAIQKLEVVPLTSYCLAPD